MSHSVIVCVCVCVCVCARVQWNKSVQYGMWNSILLFSHGLVFSYVNAISTQASVRMFASRIHCYSTMEHVNIQHWPMLDFDTSWRSSKVQLMGNYLLWRFHLRGCARKSTHFCYFRLHPTPPASSTESTGRPTLPVSFPSLMRRCCCSPPMPPGFPPPQVVPTCPTACLPSATFPPTLEAPSSSWRSAPPLTHHFVCMMPNRIWTPAGTGHFSSVQDGICILR